MTPPRPHAALALAALALTACNAVLGIEEATLDEAIGQSQVPITDECLLTSHCAADEVCLFRACSPPCETQRDCDDDEHCLATEEGNACVPEPRNQCDGDADCPPPTICQAGRCQAECDAAEPESCVDGQRCQDGVCAVAPGDAGMAEPDGAMAPADGGGAESDGGEADCVAEATRCSADGLETCGDDGRWGEALPCAFVCADGACGGECVPDDLRCDAGVRQRCDANGAWQDEESCPALCTPDACVDSCDEGATFCSGATLLTCDGGELIEQSCPFVCSDAEGVARCAGSCLPDDRTCVGKSLQVCDAGGTWAADSECDFVCSANACVGECDPGSRACVDAGSYHVCDSGGFYQAVVACSDQACAPDTGTCIGACSPGAVRCGPSNTVQTCSATGNWVDTESCTDQTCVSAACTGMCAPAQQRCAAGPGYQSCQSDGSWGSTVSCGAAACVAGQCTGSCIPDDLRCAPGSSTEVQRCSSQGVWQGDGACVDQACVDGDCVGVCAPGDTRCAAGETVETCTSNGTWGAGVACTDQACVSGSCVGVCAPGSRTCASSTDYRVCSSQGQWGSSASCTDQACSGGVCVGVCAPSDVRCSPTQNLAERCTASGQWDEDDVCLGPDEICDAGSCEPNTPYTLGFDDVGGTGWGEYDAPADYVIAVPVEVPNDANLLSLHVRGHDTASVLARMALYDDAGGYPGDRIALSNNFTVIAGNNGVSVSATLTAGTYWLAGIFSGSAPIYRNTDVSSPDAYLYFGMFSTLPSPFPIGSATSAPDRAYSFSFVVQDLTP